ncbi:MAG: hypothetical protein Tsb0020_46110 [Haliangiales bacterium]
MTLAECAGYLHLSENTVLKLAQGSKLPGVLVRRKWRFERQQIDEWLEQQLGGGDGVEIEDLPDGMQVPLEDLMPIEAIIDDLKATTALGVVEELAARAYSNNWLYDKPWFVGALVEREALASTALEGGTAMLHTRAREAGRIARPFIIFGRSYNGIDFGAADGKPTFLFFLLGLKYDKMHLPILGRLARAMRSPTTAAKLRSLPSSTKIRALLLKKDAEARSDEPGDDEDGDDELKPTLDRKQRLRAIMRVDAQRKHRARQVEEAKKKAEKKAEKKATASKKKAAKKAATSKKAATKKTEKKAAATKKAAAKKTEKKATATKKAAAKKTEKKATATKKAATKKAQPASTGQADSATDGAKR